MTIGGIDDKGKEKNKESSKEMSNEKSEESSKEKGNEKTSQKIVVELKKNPYVTMAELQLLCSLSESGVEKQIRILKKEKCIRRKGGRRYGTWEVLI